MTQTYPELDELNEVFLGVLRADPQSPSNAALLWHEALDVDRSVSPPRVPSRGDAFLLYINNHASLNEVPGQKFAVEKLPHRVCTRFMTEHAPFNFGRDEERHFIAFPDLAACLAFWLDELTAGRCRELPPTQQNPQAWLEHELGNSLEVLRSRRAV